MEEQIKVLSANTSDASGGAARAAYRIHGGVRKLGINSYMFVKDKRLSDETVLSLTPFVPVNALYSLYYYIEHKIKNRIQRARWRKYPRRDDVFLSDLRSVSLHGALQKIDFDILHLHWINLRFLNLKELLKIQRPIVWTLHDSWAFTGICHYSYDCDKFKSQCGACPFLRSSDNDDLSHRVWKEKKMIYHKLNLHIVTPSTWLADLARESTLLKNFPITVIPNCLDTDVFKPVDKVHVLSDLGLNNSKKKILFGAVNALNDSNKGFKQLIEALSHFEHSVDCSKYELLVFGTDKPINEIQTPLQIHYLGYIKQDTELVKVYNAADVMVVPSLSEVFGQTASEAMACGTPVVAFNCTGIKEVVEHKITGYLAEPYSPEDLANGILWCEQNNLFGELSVNARNRVVENYSVERVAAKYKALYKNLF